MATDESFVEHVADQARLGGRLTYRKMFGEYGIYVDGKFVAMACDDSLFLKPTRAIEEHGLDLPRRPPYPGATPHPVADELIDDAETLARILLATAASLPAPKAKTAKRHRASKS
jgi:TfoX/Sxy family transcriptional regulator of competence genes